MKIIDEEKVKNAAAEYANEHWGYNYVTENKLHDENAFEAGVKFAETELSNLAIEFAKYDTTLFHCSFNEWAKLSMEELFEKFIEQRKKL